MEKEYRCFLAQLSDLHDAMIGFNGLLQAVSEVAPCPACSPVSDAVTGLGTYFRTILDAMDQTLSSHPKGVSV